jgi:hypothetical protein
VPNEETFRLGCNSRPALEGLGVIEQLSMLQAVAELTDQLRHPGVAL